MEKIAKIPIEMVISYIFSYTYTCEKKPPIKSILRNPCTFQSVANIFEKLVFGGCR